MGFAGSLDFIFLTLNTIRTIKITVKANKNKYEYFRPPLSTIYPTDNGPIDAPKEANAFTSEANAPEFIGVLVCVGMVTPYVLHILLNANANTNDNTIDKRILNPNTKAINGAIQTVASIQPKVTIQGLILLHRLTVKTGPIHIESGMDNVINVDRDDDTPKTSYKRLGIQFTTP